MKTALFVLLSSLALLAPAGRAHADAYPPEHLTYQSYLTDKFGNALATNGPRNFDVIFRIYDDPNGGTNLWMEQQTVTVDKGYFSVLLGEGTASPNENHPLLSTLFTNTTASDRYVEMTVKGIGSGTTPDVTLMPRLQLQTSPYAFLARHAVTAANADKAASLASGTGLQIVTVNGTNVTVAGAVTASAFVGDAFVGDGSGLTNVAKLNANQTLKGTNTFSAPVTAAAFIGDGSGLTNLNAATLTSGMLPDARLTGNIAKLNAVQNFSGVNSFANIFATKVGIGTSSPTAPLTVAAPSLSSGENTATFRVAGDGYLLSHVHYGTNGDWYIRSASSGGKVVIQDYGGTFSCNASTVSINATNMYLPNLPSGDYSDVQVDRGNGRLYALTSSRRYKENIRPLVVDFDRLLLAEPKAYTRPGVPDRWEIGYIAEEIHDLGLTALVEYDTAGQPEGVNYKKSVLYLVEIAKGQRTQIERLNHIAADQQLQVEALQASVAELQAAVRRLTPGAK